MIKLFTCLFLVSINLLISAEESSKPLVFDDKNFEVFLDKKRSPLSSLKDYFSIEDGVLHVYPNADKNDRPNFILVSKKSYEKYTLSFDFKWGKLNEHLDPKKITAGIYLHAFEDPLNLDKKYFPKSIECKLLQGKEGMGWIVGVESKVIVSGAKKFKGDKGSFVKGRVDIPKGVSGFEKWHKVEILVNKDKCSFLVNGKTTLSFSEIRTTDKESIQNGRFAFGFEGAEMLLKNIHLRVVE